MQARAITQLFSVDVEKSLFEIKSGHDDQKRTQDFQIGVTPIFFSAAPTFLSATSNFRLLGAALRNWCGALKLRCGAKKIYVEGVIGFF